LQNTLCACKVNHRSNRTAFPLPAKAGSIHAGEYLMSDRLLAWLLVLATIACAGEWRW